MTKPMIHLQIHDQVALQAAFPAEQVQLLSDVAATTLSMLQQSDAELSIVITTDAEMRSLNQQYRGVDAATDVLSFAAEPLPPEIAAEEDENYLGDLILAYAYTLNHALQRNVAPQDEFALLIVHGILHLLGHDHDSQAAQQKMWAKQRKLLLAQGIDIVVPDFIHGLDD